MSDDPSQESKDLFQPGIPAELPPTLEGFDIVRALGSGGMGDVFEAIHRASGRHVALKFPRSTSTDPMTRKRLDRELEAIASLSHPHCGVLYDAHATPHGPVLEMELLRGGSLQAVVTADERPPTHRAVQWALQLLDALSYAFERHGLIHRDVKPSNCLLDDHGNAKLIDFGLVRNTTANAEATRQGQFLGSPGYASPEQTRGDSIDQRTDIYGVAATLYALLCGHPPHTGGSYEEIVASTLNSSAPSIAATRPDLPARLMEIVEKSLDPEPTKRHQSFAELRGDLFPYSPARSGPASVLARFGAATFDLAWIFLMTLGAAHGLHRLDVSAFSSDPAFSNVIQTLPGMSLFAALFLVATTVLEGRTGAAPGKRLFRIAVRSRGLRQPGQARACLRALCFVPLFLLYPALTTDTGSQALGVHYYEWAVLAICGLLLVSARPRNGLRGLHEFASGTRTVTVPPRHRVSPLPSIARGRGVPSDRHEGRFKEFEVLAQTEHGPLHRAFDEELARHVLLVKKGPRGSAATSQLSSHPTGLEAYLDPGGAPIDLSDLQCTLTWDQVRQAMIQLCLDLRGVSAPCRTSDLWIDEGGRLRYFALGIVGERTEPVPPSRLMASSFETLLARCDRRSLPLHVDRIVRRMREQPDPNEALWVFRAALDQPADVSRFDRVAHALGASAWPLVFYCSLLHLVEPTLQDLLALSGVLVLIHIPVVLSAIALPLITGWAPTLAIAGLGIRSSRGEPAGRVRTCVRSFLAWSPLLAFTELAFGGSSDRALVLAVMQLFGRIPSWQQSSVIIAAGVSIWMVMAIGLATSILGVRRGLLDHFAGTWVVRR